MIEQRSIDFLKRLSEAFGPSGFEREPARLLKDYVEPYCDEVRTDKLGSLLFTKKGAAAGPTVLLPGHIDEVGFIVAGINKQGFLTFNPVGGWYDQVLLAQRVLVRTRKGEILRGVIAAKPPHLLEPEERTKVVKQEKMFIDIGASSREEATAMGVTIGDPIVPDSSFATIVKPVFEEKRQKGEATLCMGKAFDDRIGAFMAAEVVRRLREGAIEHPNTVIGAGTVQEEVGLRGARTTAWMAQPDVCLTLEVDIAKDIAGIDQETAPIKLGGGPSILTFDASMVPNQRLKELVIATAEEQEIPYQLSQARRGGTDAGAIHISHAGCPSLVLGVPTRHIHSHVGILSLEDVAHCIQLVVATVQRLDSATVESFTAL
jgi:putative aminopeptidase FrvX